MQLQYTCIGSGPSLIILHGLYGQGDNWLSIARILSTSHTVYLVDQRNHGKSSHSPVHSYDEMALDLLELCNVLDLKSFDLIGHSMGGKTAMTFCLKYPGFVRKLVVVDISPYSYLEQNQPNNQLNFHRKVLECFRNAPIQTSKNRVEIEEFFMEQLENSFICKFLLKNLRRTKNGDFLWQLNVNALWNNLEILIDSVPPVKMGAQSSIPVLFLKGGKSPYLSNEDVLAIPDVFKNSKFISFENAGHWLHVEETERFVETTENFLTNKQ
jgi:esterase